MTLRGGDQPPRFVAQVVTAIEPSPLHRNHLRVIRGVAIPIIEKADGVARFVTIAGLQQLGEPCGLWSFHAAKSDRNQAIAVPRTGRGTPIA